MSPRNLTWIPNPPARLAWMIVCAAFVLGGLLGIAVFRLGPLETVIATIVGISFPIAVVRRHLFTSIGFAQGLVVLKGLFLSINVGSDDVAGITCIPPLSSDSMRIVWWGSIESVCKIRLNTGKEITVTMMADGLKLKIIEALQAGTSRDLGLHSALSSTAKSTAKGA